MTKNIHKKFKVMERKFIKISICLTMFSLMFIGMAKAQQNEITGIVRDTSGKPVQGAIILVTEHSDTQAVSDKDGKFVIDGQIGQHVEARTENKASGKMKIVKPDINITLKNGTSVIPIGFGQTRKVDEMTSSVGFVSGQKLTNKGVINPENALYGLIPGLTVLQNGGEPPTNVNMFIRGRETFNDNSILVLVDGFERPLSSLSPGEIESITVLKDAAALAQYGQHGANGVLLITTKRGKSDELQVNFSYDQSITSPTRLPEFLNSGTYASAMNEALQNDGLAPRYSQAEIDAYNSGADPYLFPNVNWFNQVLRDYGNRSNFNITFNGGVSNAHYFVLMNYVNDQGLFSPVNQNDGYSTQLKYGRFNFRSNLDVNLTDNLLFQVDVAGNVINQNKPKGGNGPSQIFNALYSIPSAAFPVKTPDGNWGGSQIYGNNPVAITSSTGYSSPNSRELFLDGKLNQDLNKFLPGLSAEAAISYNNYASYWESKTKQYSYEVINPVLDNGGNIIDTTTTTYGEDTELNYWSSFGNQRRSSDLLGKLNYSRNFGDNELQSMVLFHQNSMIFNGQNNTYHRRNFAGNIHYGIKQKYYLDVTASYSGNNLLPKGNRYGIFPAVSGAWILSKESFLANANFLDRLKLRASWGMTGNDRLPTNNPDIQAYHGGNGYWFTNQNNYQGGFVEGRLATSNLTYESSYKTNFGIDAYLFNKLALNIDLFYAKRTNILTNTDGLISNVLGVQDPLSTDGIVENKGIDVDLLWQDHVGSLQYHIGGQFSYAKNKILDMNEAYRPYPYLKRTGNSIGQSFGLQAVGFFKDQNDIANSSRQLFSEVRPGDIKYKDQNGDGVINEYDEVPLGYSTGYPEISFSANLGFDYKGIGVSALFQGTAHYNAYLNTQSVYWPLRANNTISSYYYNRRWTAANAQSATFPRLTTESNDNNFRPNSIWLADRSFVKLRMLEVSYALPVSFIQQWKMNSVKLYARGMNLFSIDNIDVLDPEFVSSGYPTLRSYNLGLHIAF